MREIAGFTTWVYSEIWQLKNQNKLVENFFRFQCLLFSLLVIFCGGQRTEMFAQLNEQVIFFFTIKNSQFFFTIKNSQFFFTIKNSQFFFTIKNSQFF